MPQTWDTGFALPWRATEKLRQYAFTAQSDCDHKLHRFDPTRHNASYTLDRNDCRDLGTVSMRICAEGQPCRRFFSRSQLLAYFASFPRQHCMQKRWGPIRGHGRL